MNDTSQQVKLINQALAAAGASIELARKLLSDISPSPILPARPVVSHPLSPSRKSPPLEVPSASSIPGIVGTFDGESLITEDGKKYPIPENYLSKSMVVYGDKLKMIDGDKIGREGKVFKQIERVKRQRLVGIIHEKEGLWTLVTESGVFKVLNSAVKHLGAKVGSEAIGLLPKDKKEVPFAALESLAKAPPPPINPPIVPGERPKELRTLTKPVEAAAVEPQTKKEPKKIVKKTEKLEETAGKVDETPKKEDPKEKEKKGEPLIGDEDLR